MTTNLDNWKAGLTVEDFIADGCCQLVCSICPVKKASSRVLCIGGCTAYFRAWAESEYIPPTPEKTKVDQLGDLLGVGVGEKFNIRWSGGLLSQCNPCVLIAEGYILTADNGRADNLFPALLNGEATVEKIPQQPEEWKPKEGCTYYFIRPTGGISQDIWDAGSSVDFGRYAFGNCFPTEEAAEAGKADVMAKYEAIRAEIGE